MAHDTTILSGDIGVWWFANNRGKMLHWIGSTGTYKMNQVYSAMQTLQDESTTIDDGTCFFADTPVEYTVGIIDSGDLDPWYISFDLMEHITNGALRTSSWQRVTDTNTGIVVVPVATSGTITAADRGNDIAGATTGAGTLLEFIDTGSTYDYCVIRPNSFAAANDFTTGSQVLTETGSSHAATQWASSNSTTGEMIWPNLYSLGTIDPNVHIYLYQGDVATDGDRVRRYSWNDVTQDWYGNGHIDVCVPMKSIEDATWDFIDDGYFTGFGRKYGDTYSHFEVECSQTSGGRNPIPLGTEADGENTTGIKQVDTGAWSGAFTAGEIISGGSSGGRGLATAVSASSTTITYIPIDDPQVDFSGTEVVTGLTTSATATTIASTPVTSVGPAVASWYTNSATPTATFAHATADIDNNGTDEFYAITIDCNSATLSEVYEWSKWQMRNGETTNDLDGINGECYIGGEAYLKWSGSVSGTISEGDDVSQASTSATGVVISIDDTTDKVALLRNVRGTFSTTDLITSTDNSGTVTANTSAVNFAPKAVAPFGTIAQGIFFGARGVLLTSWRTADENKFFLLPTNATTTVSRPTAYEIEVTNLVGTDQTTATDDWVGVFRLTGSGGSIDKTEYDATGGEAIDAGTINIAAELADDVPGKSSGATIMLVDDPAGTGTEYRLRFDSWSKGSSSSTTVTFSKIAVTAESSTTSTLIKDTGVFTSAQRGDLVLNKSRSNAVSYVTKVSDANTITISPAIDSQTATDLISLNAAPVAITASDDAYFPIIHKYATTSAESVSLIYTSSTVNYRVKCRNTRAATKIKPFSADDAANGADRSVPVVRTTDSIIS